LQNAIGIQVELSDVLCVPTFKMNVMSETQLMCRGVSVYESHGKVSLTDKQEHVFMRRNIEDGRIRIQSKIVTPQNTCACKFEV
jgi:hypothetical protein